VVAFCWSFGIGRDLSTATSWAPTEQWPGERHLCFPSYREYKTRQRALWIAERLQSIVGPDYMNRVWRFKVWLSRTRLPLTAPRALGGATELQSEKECLVCLAPPAVRGAPLVAYVCWRARSSRLVRRPPSLHLRSPRRSLWHAGRILSGIRVGMHRSAQSAGIAGCSERLAVPSAARGFPTCTAREQSEQEEEEGSYRATPPRIFFWMPMPWLNRQWSHQSRSCSMYEPEAVWHGRIATAG
jgi:hypothetical protein